MKTIGRKLLDAIQVARREVPYTYSFLSRIPLSEQSGGKTVCVSRSPRKLLRIYGLVGKLPPPRNCRRSRRARRPRRQPLGKGARDRHRHQSRALSRAEKTRLVAFGHSHQTRRVGRGF